MLTLLFISNYNFCKVRAAVSKIAAALCVLPALPVGGASNWGSHVRTLTPTHTPQLHAYHTVTSTDHSTHLHCMHACNALTSTVCMQCSHLHRSPDPPPQHAYNVLTSISTAFIQLYLHCIYTTLPPPPLHSYNLISTSPWGAIDRLYVRLVSLIYGIGTRVPLGSQ